jgi:hypothetical protein
MVLFFRVYASTDFEIESMGRGADAEEDRRCNTSSFSHSGGWKGGLNRLREADLDEGFYAFARPNR